MIDINNISNNIYQQKDNNENNKQKSARNFLSPLKKTNSNSNSNNYNKINQNPYSNGNSDSKVNNIKSNTMESSKKKSSSSGCHCISF